MLEIERKFLVHSDLIGHLLLFKEGTEIRQGYLADSENAMIRVRTYGDKAYLTIKSSIPEDYAVEEFEYEIPYNDCTQLLDKCEASLVKTRYNLIDNDNHWEVDVFSNGLILAEFEHSDREVVENVELPYWISDEVTNNKSYSNFNLARNKQII